MSAIPTHATPNASTAERKQLALQRLEASRSQLIVHIYPAPDQRKRGGAPPSGSQPVWNGMAGLMARAQRNGFVNAAWRTARALGRRWWTRQPWHASVDLVASTLAHEAKPIMRQHPLATLAVGSAAGAALVLVLPWAARSIKTQAGPWRNNLGGMIWHQLGQAPVQLALTGALTAWIAELGQRSVATTKAPAATEPPGAPSKPPPRPSAPTAAPSSH